MSQVIKDVVEAIHGVLGVVQTQVSVLFFEHAFEDFGVAEVGLRSCRGLDAVDNIMDRLLGVVLHEVVVELLPELVASSSVFVFFDGDAAKGEHRQRV